MKDFVFRNDTKLLFRNDITETVADIARGHKVMFVYGGGSAARNGCLADVTSALAGAGIGWVEFGGSSREFGRIEQGIELALAEGVTMVIGAGGASVMDSAKLIAFGVRHRDGLWEYLKGKSPYGLDRLALALIPTYPSSGSENGLGAVAVDSRTGDFGTAYGIAADYAILCPRYSLTLGPEMTAYTGLVTLVQLSAAIIGDTNRMSYDAGIAYIRNVLEATRTLMTDPADTDARGIILMGAALSTSSRLGIGKESNYAYDIYEIEFIPEQLFGAPYRRSLTAVFPRFLERVARRHEGDVRRYFRDAFGFDGTVGDSVRRLTGLFGSFGVDMYFDGPVSRGQVEAIPCETELEPDEIFGLVCDMIRTQ